ncbi:hypothetical protein F4781DRAFT_427441 [Annulohypoxylon bovei var. microspora]|nr:hypothetical protein F4781DRAFT_427441 [Annulohypoxylon bovei var. microspora]
MSKKGLKRKPGLQFLADEIDDLFAQDNNAKRNKLEDTNKKLSRLDEYDKDEGREGSRNFQHWAEIFESNTKSEVMKSKTFMKNFGVKVKKQKDRVQEYMQEQETKLAGSDDRFVEIFEKLYSETPTTPSIPDKLDGEAPSAGKEDHFLFKDAQSVISGGYSLLKQFKETEEQLKNYKLDLPTTKWKQDGRDMKELLACGREYGEKLIEEKLVPKAYPSPHPDRYKVDEKDNIISELFNDSRKAANEDNWGTIAADQVKKLTAIAKTIPFKTPERTAH